MLSAHRYFIPSIRDLSILTELLLIVIAGREVSAKNLCEVEIENNAALLSANRDWKRSSPVRILIVREPAIVSTKKPVGIPVGTDPAQSFGQLCSGPIFRNKK